MFKSCEGPPTIEFYNQSKDDNIIDEDKNKDDTNKPQVQMEDKITETDQKEQVEEGTQLNLKDLYSIKKLQNYDEEKLKNFLNKAYILVNYALETQIKDLYYENESEEINPKNYTYKVLFKFPVMKIESNKKNSNISDIIWNKTGDTLAVSFSENVHIDPCSHNGIIKFFIFESLFSSDDTEDTGGEKVIDYKTIELEFNSCIKCIDSHPKFSNIFVAGGFNGEIYYINLSKERNNDYIEFISKIDSSLYKECVVSVKFVKFDDKTYYIASISEEGRLLLWNPERQLKYPIIGYNLKHKVERNILPISPTVLINNPFESCDFRVGAYDGNIYKVNFSNPNFDSGINHDNIFKDNKGIVWRNDVRIFISNMKDSEIKEMKTLIENKCKDRKISNLTMEEFLKLRPNVNKIYVNAIKAIYERHFSPITSINFNYFVKNLLATTSYDGGLRLYYGDENGLKYFYTKICSLKEKKSSDADYYTYTTWSPYKPKILISGNSVGEIEFDILTNKKSLLNVGKIENKGMSPVVKIIFNPNESMYKNVLTVCYKEGIVELIKLSDSFSQIKMNEIENIIKNIKI